MSTDTQDEHDACVDLAEAVALAAWKRLSGHDALAALYVIGILIASIERELNWPREKILDRVNEIADACDQMVQ